MNNLGIYIHVPFCESKCAYCDFYSFKASDDLYDQYTAALLKHISAAGERLSKNIDTIYFGGGTPSLLGEKRIARLIEGINNAFYVKDCEITVEVNPADNLKEDLLILANSGVNRISLGVQSANQNELDALSRRHCNNDVLRTINNIKQAGISNISGDLILGIPHQTMDTLKDSIDFLLSLDLTHISCYMLSIEPNTPFGKADRSALCLPSDDVVTNMYLFTAQYLEGKGFEHYEISNFAKKGFRSRHNTKYWKCDEYLGLGPAAHSFINGNRFYFERDIDAYIKSAKPIHDGCGGDIEEYIMLNARLKDGINYEDFKNRFNSPLSSNVIKAAKELEKFGLAKANESGFNLTTQGFLVSNSCIEKLINNL